MRHRLCKLAQHWPWPVQKRLIRDHVSRGRWKPGCRIVGSVTTVRLTTEADDQSSLHNDSTGHLGYYPQSGLIKRLDVFHIIRAPASQLRNTTQCNQTCWDSGRFGANEPSDRRSKYLAVFGAPTSKWCGGKPSTSTIFIIWSNYTHTATVIIHMMHSSECDIQIWRTRGWKCHTSAQTKRDILGYLCRHTAWPQQLWSYDLMALYKYVYYYYYY